MYLRISSAISYRISFKHALIKIVENVPFCLSDQCVLDIVLFKTSVLDLVSKPQIRKKLNLMS